MARITVVNSEADFLDLMTTILDETEGHEVTGLDSSEATMDDVVRSCPDVLIADLVKAEGLLTATDFMEDDSSAALGRVPMIVCTIDTSAVSKRASSATVSSQILALEKPFTIEMLAGVVERALREPADRSIPSSAPPTSVAI